MPKPLSGSILTRRLADDTLVVDVKIRTERRMLGPGVRVERDARPEAARAQAAAGRAAAPGLDCADPRCRQTGRPTARPRASLTVREAATDYVEALSRYENPNTVSAYRSPVVKHLLPFLAYVDDERTRGPRCSPTSTRL